MKRSTIVGLLLVLTIESACTVSPIKYVERGNKLFASAQYADAEINYRKAIQKDSRLGEAFYRLGLAQLREGRPEGAYESLLSAVNLMPARQDAAVSLADAAFAAYLRNPRVAPYYQQVVETSGRFLRANPGSYDGLRLKGYVEMFDRHYSQAVDLLKSADQVRPHQEDLVFALVQCLILAQRGPEAEKLALSLIHTNKTFEPVYDTLYRYYMSERRQTEAEGVLKAEVDSKPESVGYRLELAAHYAAAGNEAALKQTIQQLGDLKRFPDAPLHVGSFYETLGRPEDAVRELRSGAEKDSKRRPIYQKQIARVLLAEGKRDEAGKVIDQLLKEDKDDYDARMMRASVNVESGDPGKLNSGVVELEDLAQKKPSDATVRFNLGKARLLAGDSRGALARFKETLKIDPQLKEARLLAADTSLRIPDYAQALQYADEALQLSPNIPVARLIRVKALAGMGNTSQASAEVAQLSKDFPAETAPQLELAFLRLGQKNFAAAESMYKALYSRDRGNRQALQGLVQALFLQNKSDSAIELLKAEVANGGVTEIRAMLAEAYLTAGRLDQAAEAYGSLAGANPNSPIYHLKLGDALLRKGNAQEAVAQFRAASKLAPKDAMTNSLLALGLQGAGRVPEAIQAYRTALALDSENPLLMNNLAYLIAENGGDLNEALQLAENAARRRPGDGALEDTVGLIYIKKNMPDDAMRVLSSVVRQNPAHPVYRYHLASALLQKGDKDDARKQLEAALGEKPERADEVKIAELLSATH